MAVRALTFDITGTVFDWLGSFSEGVPPLAQKYGLNLDPGAFARGAEAGYSDGVGAVLGGGPWEPPDEILRNHLVVSLRARGMGLLPRHGQQALADEH